MRKPIKDHVPTLHMLLKVAIYFLFETENTGLVVIAVYAFLRLPKLSELWIEFRTGKTMEFVSVHEIKNSLEVIRSQSLKISKSY